MSQIIDKSSIRRYNGIELIILIDRALDTVERNNRGVSPTVVTPGGRNAAVWRFLLAGVASGVATLHNMNMATFSHRHLPGIRTTIAN